METQYYGDYPIIDRIIKENDCEGMYAYLDNSTVGEKF